MSKQKRQVLEILNKFGFASVHEIALVYKSSLRQSYRYLEDLNALGLTQQKRFFISYSNVHWLTEEGVQLCGIPLPIIKQPSIFTLEHDIKVIRLYAHLKEQAKNQNPNTTFNWYTPRELKSKNIIETTELRIQIHKITKELPDAMIINNDIKIAIELEKSYKLDSKWTRKIANYKKLLDQKIISRVLYYIENEAIGKALLGVIESTAPGSEIKIIKWHDDQKPIQ